MGKPDYQRGLMIDSLECMIEKGYELIELAAEGTDFYAAWMVVTVTSKAASFIGGKLESRTWEGNIQQRIIQWAPRN